ncbi:PaaX family transcriptional regulator [Nocardioides hungaricus]
MDPRTPSAQDGAEPRPSAVVVDLLGDLNRAGIRELRLKTLVALGEQLAIPGPTMRVTLARLRKRGWFEVSREGRESIYRLAPACLRVLNDGARRIFRPPSEPWTGNWSMIIYTVPEPDRQTREELRKQLTWNGFGPLAPATWICPHPRLPQVADATAHLAAARLTMLTTKTAGLAEDRALVVRCWDVSHLEAAYQDFIRALRRRMGDYRSGALDGGTALAERIALVHRFRLLAREDPQFPAELQPPGWPGDEARRLFDEAHALLADGAAAHYATALSQDSVSFH